MKLSEAVWHVSYLKDLGWQRIPKTTIFRRRYKRGNLFYTHQITFMEFALYNGLKYDMILEIEKLADRKLEEASLKQKAN